MNEFYEFIFNDIKNVEKIRVQEIQANEYKCIKQFYIDCNINMYSSKYCFSGYLDEEPFIVYKDVSNRYILSTNTISVEIPYVFFNDYLGFVTVKEDNKIFSYNTDPHSNRYLKIIDNNLIIEEKYELVRNPNKGKEILSDSLNNIGNYLYSYDQLDNNLFDNYYINYSEKSIKKYISNNESIFCKIQYLWNSKEDIEKDNPMVLTGGIDYKLDKYWVVNNFAYVKDGEYHSLICNDYFDCYASFLEYLKLYNIKIEHSVYFKYSAQKNLPTPKVLFVLREIINEYLNLERLGLEDKNFNFISNDINVIKNESVKSLILRIDK